MNTLSGWDQVTVIQWATLLHVVPCENWIWCYKFNYCPRSGPNWRDPREVLGQRGDQPMLPAVSTMERSTPSCWSLGDVVEMTTLCRMHGSWMSTLGGGGRWVVMNVGLVQLTESVIQIKSMPISLVYVTLTALTKVADHTYTNFEHDMRICWSLAEACR